MAQSSEIYCFNCGNKFKIKGGFILWQGQVTLYHQDQQEAHKNERRKLQNEVKNEMIRLNKSQES